LERAASHNTDTNPIVQPTDRNPLGSINHNALSRNSTPRLYSDAPQTEV
jgi:hypothetical protein